MHPAIVGAGRATLMVSTGESKAEMLRRWCSARSGTYRRWPAQLACHDRATWILDEAAASRSRERDRFAASRPPDGTPIAVFRSGTPEGPPVLLIHGTTADHTTFRTVGPMLGTTYDVYAMDRRGRGDSGDTLPYSIVREFEDAGRRRGGRLPPIAGRPSTSSATRTGAERPSGRPCARTRSPGSCATRAPPARPDPATTRRASRTACASGSTPATGTAPSRCSWPRSSACRRRRSPSYRANPVWPIRAAAAGTILRELDAELEPAASLDALGAVRQPVLQILGSASLPVFHEATAALDARLVGRPDRRSSMALATPPTTPIRRPSSPRSGPS